MAEIDVQSVNRKHEIVESLVDADGRIERGVRGADVASVKCGRVLVVLRKPRSLIK